MCHLKVKLWVKLDLLRIGNTEVCTKEPFEGIGK